MRSNHNKTTRYDIAKRYATVLRECATAGVAVDDWRNIHIYEEIQRLRGDGLKMEYCVAYASDKYAISTARVWRIMQHLRAKV